MKKYGEELAISELQIPLARFLKSYNETIPVDFPRASAALLRKFKDTHTGLFKHGDLWSLDEHRKRILDWLPQNIAAAKIAE
ncbi:MAG TPA: hypothetical protein VM103_02685 [Candidatus Paceibacterota bacterium]|nr:hypothetical protein [Candidatus Paceibacterota bacterium]